MVTSSLDTFLREPHGRFEGTHFTFWSLGHVSGWKVWGKPDVHDGQQLVACIETLLRPRAPRYWSLVDLRALEVVGELGFEVLRAWVERHRAALAKRLVRQAVLKPKGVVGAMVAGFYVQLTPGHPVRVFESVDEACLWLEVPPAASRTSRRSAGGNVLPSRATSADAPPARRLRARERPREVAPSRTPRALGEPALARDTDSGLEPRLQLEHLVAELDRAVPDTRFLPTLRRWLAEHPEATRAPDAARALGLSTRTLHRRLAEEASAFHLELRRARVERAQTLLRDTDWKLTHIAQEVGFPSSQRLATAFREVLGLTPTAFRASARGGVTVAPGRTSLAPR
ncbi:MAG: helix-turn-helix transcriptional regulator [Archangium sp.]|nr:helix-turn-helix transcriptional regulator [Archangium sp.]